MNLSRAPFWLVDIVAMLCIAALAYVGKISADTAVILFASMLGLSGIARVRPPGPPPNAAPVLQSPAGSCIANTAGLTTMIVSLATLASRVRFA